VMQTIDLEFEDSDNEIKVSVELKTDKLVAEIMRCSLNRWGYHSEFEEFLSEVASSLEEYVSNIEDKKKQEYIKGDVRELFQFAFKDPEDWHEDTDLT